MSAKRLGDLIGGSGALAKLADTARRHTREANDLRALLPDGLREHVRLCSLDPDGTVVLTAGSAAWATRLRYSASDIVARYRAAGYDAERVVVRVRPDGGQA